MVKNEHTPGPWAYAWQTSYTGDQWHFAREVAFASMDIERGIVLNVTPLYHEPTGFLDALKAIASPEKTTFSSKERLVEYARAAIAKATGVPSHD